MKYMRPFKSYHASGKGFTLFEVILAIIVVSLVGVLITSQYLPTDTEDFAQVEIVKNHIRYVQLRSMKENVPQNNRWGISLQGGSYFAFQGTTASTRILPGEENGTHQLPPGITTNVIDLYFNNLGTPQTSLGVDLPDTTITVGSQSFVLSAETGFIP